MSDYNLKDLRDIIALLERSSWRQGYLEALEDMRKFLSSEHHNLAHWLETKVRNLSDEGGRERDNYTKSKQVALDIVKGLNTGR
jgi:hypothetical protein